MKKRFSALLLALSITFSIFSQGVFAQETEGGALESEAPAAPTVSSPAEPAGEPTVIPTVEPAAEPSAAPTAEPTAEPSPEPSVEPSAEPTEEPVLEGEQLEGPESLALTAISVSGAEGAEALAVGSTLQMTATLTPADTQDTGLLWSIQSGSGASIDENGLLSASAVGTVVVRATSATVEGVYGEASVRIGLSGKYLLVLNKNTDPTRSQSTGTLVFSGGTGSGAATGSSSYTPYSYVAGSASVSGYIVGQSKTIGSTSYVCIGVGEHCYVWMETGLHSDYVAAEKLDTAAAEMLAIYAGKPYTALKTLADGEIPAMDGSQKLSILLEQLSSSTGYFAGEDGITAIHIKTPAAADYDYGDLAGYNGLLAHEGQHALFQHFVCGDNSGVEFPLRWLNEGLAVAAMDWVWGGDGNGANGWLSTISGNNSIRWGSSLAYSVYRESSGLDYGLPYLFVRYLTDQCAQGYDPLTYSKYFYKTAFSGDVSTYMDSVLSSMGLGISFAQALENFYIAAVVQAGTGPYGFYGDPVVAARVSYPIFDGPGSTAYSLPGTGALILPLNGEIFFPPADADSDIVFRAFDEDNSGSGWQGSGTEDDPYQVDNLLGAIALNPAGSYKLTADIDASTATIFTMDSFTGTLDGDGHTISGLKTPLIYENHGTIRDLNLSFDIDSQLGGCTGGLVGVNYGDISNVHVTGSMKGSITGTNPYGIPKIGALVGENQSGTISQCSADVAMSFSLPANHVYIGQIAGENNGGIYNCLSAGSISLSPVSGPYQLYVGGLCGRLYAEMFAASLKWSYSITQISVTAAAGNTLRLGRLVGLEEPRSYQCYVESVYSLAGMSAAGGCTLAGLSDSVCVKTAGEMMAQDSYEDWDFDTVWHMPLGGYPSLTAVAAVTLTPNIAKTEYYTGESLDLTGSTLTAGSASVQLTSAMLVDVPEFSAAGSYTVNGLYMAQPFSFELTVSDPAAGAVTALSLSGVGKTSYYAGESFDPSGYLLTAVIDGVDHSISCGYTLSKTAALSVEDASIIFTYGGRSVSQAITVGARRLMSITRSSPVSKLSYKAEENLSLAGLTLSLRYSDTTVNGVLPSELEDYGLTLMQYQDNVASRISPDKVLLAAYDEGAALYISDEPANFMSSTRCYIGTLHVEHKAFLPDQRIIMHTGLSEAEYVYTDNISDGSQSYSTRLISGSLPSGVRAMLPDEYGQEYFTFYGSPSTAASTKLIYRVTDKIQNTSFDVTIYLLVTAPSDECSILSATLGGFPCVVGEDTISVILPAGSSKVGLKLYATRSPGADQVPWNGTSFDLSSPKTITVTSQSGNCVKTYTLTATTAVDEALPAPTGLLRSGSVVSWDAVDGASAYFVSLMKGSQDYETVKTLTIEETTFDMLEHIPQSGVYHIRVRAATTDGTRPAGESAESSSCYLELNPATVSGVTLQGPARITLGQSGSYTATVSPAEVANSSIIWSVINGTGAAAVTQEGVVTGLAAGSVTVVATSADLGAVKKTMSIQIMYAETATRLSARLDGYSSSGLQKGYSVSMLVYGTDENAALSSEYLDFTSSQEQIATVDENGVITAEENAGTVTVTAALRNDPLGRKVSLSLKVIPLLTAGVALSPQEPMPLLPDGSSVEKIGPDADSRYQLVFDKSKLGTGSVPYTFTLSPSVFGVGEGGNEEPVSTALSYTSSDSNIATVSVARDGTVTVSVKRTAAATGECVITGTSKEAAAALRKSNTLSISVRDYSPRIGANKLTLNPKLISGVSTQLLSSYGNDISDVEIYEYNSATKAYDILSTRLLVSYTNNQLTINPASASIANATVKTQLVVTCQDKPYELPMTVTVKSSQPAITVKQSAKFNLFYAKNDFDTLLTATAKGCEVTGIALEHNDASVFTEDASVTTADNSIAIVYKDGTAYNARPNAKLNLLVSIEGYSEPIKKAVTLATVTTKPSLSLTPASSYINTALDQKSTTFSVYDKTAKDSLDLEMDNDVTSTSAFIQSPAVDLDADTVTLTLSGTVGGKAILNVRKSNWLLPVTLYHTITVQTTKPTAKLSAGTLKLNSNLALTGEPEDAPAGAKATTRIVLSQVNQTLSDILVASTASTDALRAQAAKLDYSVDPVSGEICFYVIDSSIKAGTYSFKLTPKLDEDSSLTALTVRVAVSAAKPKASLVSSVWKLNSNYQGSETAASAFKLSMAGYTLTAVGVAKPTANKLADGAIDFTFDPVNEVLSAKLAAAVAKGTYSYTLTPKVMYDGLTNEIALAPITLKITVYSSTAISAAVSASGKLDAIRRAPDTSTITYTVTRLNNISGKVNGVELRGADADKFNVTLGEPTAKGQTTAKLTLKPDGSYATNVTYKVQLAFDVVNGVNEPVATVTTPNLSVRVTQSALKLSLSPTSAAVYHSHVLPLSFKLTLTSPLDVDIESVAVNASTPLALRQALGNNEPVFSHDSSTVTLQIENAARLKAGSSYTLVLNVTPTGSAANVKPTQLRVTVKAYK